VTGHASQAVEQFLWGEDRVAIEAIYNPEYATLNNWYSLLVGLRSLDLEQGAGVIVLNADFVAPVEWMAQFIVESVRGSADALVAVDLERPLSEEAMKVSVSREDSSQSKLRCIGKVGVDEPVGEYVGMLMARGPVLTQLLETLESYRGCEDLDDAWYEQAVGQTADHGARWGIWPTPDSAWVEIDDHDDYLAALELVAGFSPGSREPA
jgi:choline kinase